MKKILLWLLVLTMCVSMVASFSLAEVRTIRVGVSWNEKIHALVQAWQDYMQEYGKEYGAKNGIKFEWIINVADGDPARQQANIEDLITQKVDVIIVRAQDAAAIGASIKAAKDAGIPFITLDRESSTIKPDAHVGSDAYSMARSAAEYLAGLLKEKGVKGKAIELVGDLLDMNAVYFSQAWNEVGKESGQWETVVQVPTEWKPEKFKSGLAAALAAHPEANVLFSASDFCFSAVEAALEEAGRLAPTGDPKHIWTAATTCSSQGYDAILNGYIDIATTVEGYLTAVEAIQTIVPLVLGGISIGTRHLVPGRIATPGTIADMQYMWMHEKKYQD
jgi:ribose transport system substrate-binding protein